MNCLLSIIGTIGGIVVIGFSLLLHNVSGQQITEGREFYSTRYDTLDVNSILSSSRLVNNYVDCLLNKKPCPPEGKELKRILPEALRTKCGRCSPKQLDNALKVIRQLYDVYPEHYQALAAKWDTTGEYNRRFEDFLRNEQFNVISNDNTLTNGDGTRLSGNALDQTKLQQTVTRSQFDRKPIPSSSTQPETVVRFSPPQVSQVVPTQRPTRSPIGTRVVSSATSFQTAQTSVNRVQVQQNGINNFQPQQTTTTQASASFPNIEITNRFGQDDSEEQQSNMPTVVRAPLPPPPPPSPVIVQQRPTKAAEQTTTTARTALKSGFIDQFFMQPMVTTVQTSQPQNHIAGLINNIGTTITQTAELIAGMLKKTVRVFTGQT